MSMQNKTEPATPRRRDEAREEGRVAKSTDLNALLVLLVALIMFRTVGPYMMTNLISILRETLGNLHSQPLTVDTVPVLAATYGTKMCLICLPIAMAMGAAGVLSNVLQVGFKVTPKAMAPKMEKLDPFKGLTRVFSGKTLVELLKAVAKVSVVGYTVYTFLKAEYPQLTDLSGLSPEGAGSVIATLCWRMLLKAWIAILVIAALDYMYQRISFENSLKMTKQEVKEEYKRSEGDPQIKGKIRQRQREMARRRMLQDVKTADVVVVNPIHLAVAIKYDSDKMDAPTVVAKGQRLLAEKIKSVAETNGVPVVENVPVARMLYKLVEVGQVVPEQLYQAVAEILAYVYRLGDRTGQSRRAAV